jgi:O-antigen ligase
MSVILVAVLGLAPLVIAPHLLFYYDVTPKLAVVLLGTALALPWCAIHRQACRRLLAERAGRWFCALLGAQALSLALSTVLSGNPALSFSGTNWRRFGLVPQLAVLMFALTLAAWLALHPDRLRSLLRVVALSGSAIGIYGICQYFGWDPWIPAAAYHVGEGSWQIVRPPATLGHAVYFANYELFVAFLGGALASIEVQRRWKALGILAGAVATLSILLSGTRAAILGLLAGAFFLAARLRPRLTTRIIAASLMVLAALAVFYVTPPGSKLRSRVHWTATEEPLGGARTLLWRDSLSMVARRWIVGYGPETFSAEFPRFQSAGLARAYPDFYHESPHNLFLEALTAQGAIGLAPLLALIGLGLYAAWRRERRHAFAGAALAAALVSQQFSVFTVPTALYFCATLALLAAPSNGKLRGDVVRPWLWGVTVALSLGAAAVLAVFAIRLSLADRALAAVARDLESGKLAHAVQAYQVVRRLQLPGTSADLWYSRKLAAFIQATADPIQRIQAWPQAVGAAVAATRTAEDRHNAWYNLAAFYATQNDAPRAEAALRSAVACAPNWYKPHWMLSQVLRAGGRGGEALREASLAAELNGGKNTEVTRTLEEIRATSPRE